MNMSLYSNILFQSLKCSLHLERMAMAGKSLMPRRVYRHAWKPLFTEVLNSEQHKGDSRGDAGNH